MKRRGGCSFRTSDVAAGDRHPDVLDNDEQPPYYPPYYQIPDLTMQELSSISTPEDYMQLALSKAKQSPPKPTNFCVGACLVQTTASDSILLGTGYTLECEGNTHAEQSCFIKLARQHSCNEEELGHYLPPDDTICLYTTMEPCNQRSVGNLPCVDRILRLKRKDGTQAIDKVYVGVSEPETFVAVNQGKKKLEDAGIQVLHVPGMEEEILRVATAGHVNENESS